MISEPDPPDPSPASQPPGRPACVIDTNVWLDWLVFDDPRIAAIREAVANGWRVLSCPRMRDELADVLGRPAFGLDQQQRADCLARHDALVQPCGNPSPGVARALVCSDPDDQVFVDLALAHGARLLVSRDKALLGLARRARPHGLTIVAPEAWTAGAATPIVRGPWQRDYATCRDAMRRFTAGRTNQTPDEIWLVEHPPVYTLGLAGREEHLLDTGAVPVVRVERGGQVTYHGPGQVIAYTLIDIARRGLTVRGFVCLLEQAVIETLAGLGLAACRRPGAPGVYVCGPDGAPGAKIASLGLKVSRGRTWHGVALNVAMDLRPFEGINPCGMAGLAVTDLARCDILVGTGEAAGRLADAIVSNLQRHGGRR